MKSYVGKIAAEQSKQRRAGLCVCVLPWAVAPGGCALARLWSWTPRPPGRPADPEASPGPSADPQSPADVQEELWTPKKPHKFMM